MIAFGFCSLLNGFLSIFLLGMSLWGILSQSEELSSFYRLFYSIINSFGIVEMEKNMGYINGIIYEVINIADLVNGVYVLKVISGNELVNKMFIKN